MENIAPSSVVRPVQNMNNGSQNTAEQSCQDQSSIQGSGSTEIIGCCRLCCNEDSHLRELFAGGYKEELLVRKIFECTTVEITFASDPDAMICYSCVAKIEEFHHYREQCRTNDVLHRNWKRRLAGKIAAASSSTILPAKYIKKEKDTEAFEINADDFLPVDAPQQSYDTSGVHGPISSVADSSSAVNASSIRHERDAGNSLEHDEEEEEENLLEVMPERTHDRFSFSYTNDNEEFGNNDDIDCEVNIKKEVEDIDETDDMWNDYEDDVSMDHNSTTLIPLMESSSYAVVEKVAQQPFREVYNGDMLVCLVQEGYLYVEKGKGKWHCRVQDCSAAVTRHGGSQELESNDILHTHNREVKDSATDAEILQLVKNGSANQPLLDDKGEPFHYVTNIRQGNSIVYKGFRYSMKYKKRDGTIFWKCRADKGTCPAGLYQTANNHFEFYDTHSHDEPESRIENPPKKSKNHQQTLRSSLEPAKELNDGETRIIEKDEQGIVRQGYGYKIVKNDNGKLRLAFDGNLYVRKSEEPNSGVVVWRCRRNYDMCGVLALVHPDKLVKIIGNHDHGSIKNTMKIQDNMIGTREYELLPTWKGGEALMLDGYRFLKAYFRTNGMSLWRCVGSFGIVCRMKVIITPEGLAYYPKNEKHLHDRPKRSKQSLTNASDSSPTKTIPADSENKVEKKGALVVRKIDNIRPNISVAGQTAKTTSKSQTARNYRIIKNKKGNKALVYGGFRYCKIRTRQDGSVCWACRMNKKTCRAGVYQYPDGRFEWINERRHNHAPTDATDVSVPLPSSRPTSPSPAAKKPSTKVGKKGKYHIDDDTFVNSEWYLVRNRKNGATLIHAGYRYHKKATRTDNTSMWRCSQAYNGCRAAIVMYANETIAKLEDVDHDHAPPSSVKGDEDIIFNEQEESTEQLNTSKDFNSTGLKIANLNQCIEEKDDPEANMRSLLNSTLDISDEPRNESSEKIVLSAAEAHYRYVQNRRHTQSLVFRGFRYSRSTFRERTDGSVRWVCQMNKKTCRIGVKILKDGSLEMDNQKHNHPQLPEDMEDKYSDDEEEEEEEEQDEEEQDQDQEEEDEEEEEVEEEDVNDVNSSAWEETIQDHKASNSPNKQLVPKQKGPDHDFYFTLNRANGKSLIFQRNRYSKDYTRPDGSTVWRCMVRQACIGRALVRPDNTCSVYRQTYHNHPPLEVLPPPYPGDNKASTSAPKPVQPKPVALSPGLASEIQDASASLIVKGDMVFYKQNRMKKTKSFPDGTAVFACAELESCKSLVKLQLETPEGARISPPVILFEWPHNHPSFLAAPASNSSESATKNTGNSPGKAKSPSAKGGGTKGGREYQLFKSDRGHITLVYKGYRFSLRSHNNVTDDTSWKCRANRTCNAFVSFSKDGDVMRSGNGKPKAMPHNHPINGEIIERAVPFELNSLDPPAKNLGEFAANWLNGMYTGTLSGKLTNKPQSTERIDRHKIIHHKNFSYKLQTVKNGRECWRCTMFQTKACRAALFCHKNGKIVECTNGREHNHEPIKSRPDSQQDVTPRKIVKTKTTVAENAIAVYRGGSEQQSSHSKFRPSEETSESPAPAYQIVQRDGVDILHYEKHRYVALRKREADNSKARRWRCCLWDSRHQCPVELTILSTDELHFETDPTHNHRPPPAEPAEVERVSSVPTVKGTKKYQLLGRTERTVFYKGYKFSWKERREGTSYYSCICSLSHGCTMSVKIDANGYLFDCSNTTHHNHEACGYDDNQSNTSSQPCTPETVKQETKWTKLATASKMARLEKCCKVGSKDYTFLRSSQGTSMLFEGHRYWFHSKLSCGLHIYRCRYQKSRDCYGSVYMDTETNLLYNRYDTVHNHGPEDENTPNKVKNNDDAAATPPERVKPLPKVSHSESNEQSAESLTRNEIYIEGPKKERIKKEVIVTDDYSFLKDSFNKNLLLYQDYVFEFLASHYRNDGSKFYSCLYSECSGSVKMLSTGSLKVLSPIHHAHELPDVTDYRDVGRGSSEFNALPAAPGSKPVIIFEGHRYCAAVSQTQPDNTTMFYCYKKVSGTTKPDTKGRCLASLELLPNGRVIAEGIHQHPTQSQPIPIETTDSAKASESSEANLMVMEGRSYRLYDKQADGTVVWRCADDPKCLAKIYREPSGKWVYGKTKHVLRHIVPKLVNPTTTVSKAAVPAGSTTATTPNPTPSSSGNIRTKWFEGNRYNFYLTRRDGVQFWRCSKRMEDKCEAGILIYPSGTILPSNNTPHTHPKISSTASKKSPTVVVHQKILPEEPAPYNKVRERSESTSLVLIKSDPGDGDGKSKYEVLKTDDRKKLFIVYKGVQYMLRHQGPDGVGIYQCRNRYCPYTLVMSSNGKITPKTTCWHSCENQTQNNNQLTTQNNSSFTSVGDLSSDKPEIEDPDDLINQDDSTELQPITKRIRLESNLVEMEMGSTVGKQHGQQDVVVDENHTIEGWSRSESQSSQAAVEPMVVEDSLSNMPEVEQGEELFECSNSRPDSVGTEKVSIIEWEEEHLEDQNEESNEAASNDKVEEDDAIDFDVENGSDLPSNEPASSENACSSLVENVSHNEAEDNVTNPEFISQPTITPPDDNGQ